jgi:HAD superfamily hydrolase (TIGR01549 family)
MTLRAIIWDFDNTLVDTGARNLSVTRRIVTRITGRDAGDFEMLRGQDEYGRALQRTQNWQEFYSEQFGMTPLEVRQAGQLWTEFQLEDPTPTDWFPGVADTIDRLSGWPHGIVSLNTRGNIEAALAGANMSHAFDQVIGCGEVPYDRQKPSPEGLMSCVEALTGDAPGTVLYIGDHPVDSECARNADRAYSRTGRGVRVVSVAAAYGCGIDDRAWPIEALHRVLQPSEIVDLARSIDG